MAEFINAIRMARRCWNSPADNPSDKTPVQISATPIQPSIDNVGPSMKINDPNATNSGATPRING